MTDEEAKKLGATHQHFKGGYYRKLHDATVEETLEAVVVYQSIAEGTVWTRAAAVFNQEYRFRPL